ncbi:MAG: LptF/LptG family permease [Nitrospirae bacterium]|nr:LptF/LptG family permease [Candidatus Troglogloeales bacterium]
MIKLLDRYIFKEILSPFLLGVLLLTFLLLLNQILTLTEWVIDKGISILTVADLFVRMLPSFFLLTIPMAIAFATILAFNRLSFDHELIALSVSGIRVSRVLRPVFMFSVMVVFLTLLMGNLSAHWGTSSLKSTAIRMLKEKIGVGLEAGRFTEIFPGLMIYAESITDATKMDRVFIYDRRSPQHPPHVIVARSGFLMNNVGVVGLELQNGAVYTHNNLTNQRISFASYSLKVRLPLPQSPASVDGKNVQDWEKQQIAVQKKYSLAYASFLFCFLGVPLGMISGKGGRLGPFVAGILLILLYYALYNVGDYFFPPNGGASAMASWVPNMVLTPITILLFIFYTDETAFARILRKCQRGKEG